MIIVDTAVLARLRSNPNIRVYDDVVTVVKDPAQPVVITLPVPYIKYASAVGADDNRRLAGRRQRRSVPFYLTYIGDSPAQAKAVGEAARELLERWVPNVPNHRVQPVTLEESQRIRQDNDAVNPQGKPLFYGVDAYAVSIQLALLVPAF